MAASLGGESKGEKTTLMVPTMDHNQAERGGSQPERKRTFSIFGTRKRSFLKPQTLPAPDKSGLPPTARPITTHRTGSSLSVLPQPTGSSDLTSGQSQVTLLRLAATVGDIEMAKRIMDNLQQDDMLSSAGFTTQDPSGNGLLQMAALYGHVDVMEAFLARGININGVDRNHGTALQSAIYMGQEAAIRFLLNWRKDDSKTNINDRINVNTKGGYYGCALQVAAYRANDNLVRQLLQPKYQADVNIAGGKYGSALQAAVRTGRMAVVEPILKNSNVNFKGGKYGTALQATARGHYRTRRRLPEISWGQILKQSAQLSTGDHVDREENDSGDVDHVEVAKALFAKGARMNGQCGMLGNPINAAACSGSRLMLELMLTKFEDRSSEWKEPKVQVLTRALLTAITQSPENNEILARLLIENGANIQYQTSALLPNLPLEAAATKGLVGLVNYILEIKDADGNIADTLSESGIHGTALRAAIATSKPGKEEVAEVLINRIAEQWGLKERSPNEGRGPMVTSPAGVGGPASPTYHPVTRNIGHELDWTQWDSDYGNLLQLATVSGLRTTVALLLKYGADPNVRDTCQRTCLHVAAWFGFPKIVRLLLEKDADPNAKDEWGATPLEQAEESLDRKGHPGATEQDLQDIVQLLRGKMDLTGNERLGTEFRGPKRVLSGAQAPIRNAKPVFSMPFWVPGVGFRATVVDIWESADQECLLLKKPKIEEILYHSAVLDSIKNAKEKPEKAKDKLLWVHIPTNNMTWAEMVVTSLCNDKGLPAYKSYWGADPFYTSVDLSPHARFISPQCGRLVRDGPRPLGSESGPNDPKLEPLFMAMPYLHWEAYHSQRTVSNMIVNVKNESLKTSRTPNDKPPLWPSEKQTKEPVPDFEITDPGGNVISNEPKPAEVDRASLDNIDAEEDYLELLRRYLYKRRPVHLRRTLDQYYYSYLADTNDRDGDQVVMRQFNEDRKSLKLEGDGKYKMLLAKKSLMDDTTDVNPVERQLMDGDDHPSAASKLTTRQWVLKKFQESAQKKKLKDIEGKLHKVDQRLYFDSNSPVLMVDQLWLWVIDEKTIVTAFPHRQYDRDGEDLDAADKTDVLKTVMTYLHSVRRPEINSSQALAELIISQCVGVLHKSDMIPELDFLKKYSVQSNKWADQVMQMLSQFVKDFEEFMIWIKEQPAESEESIRWFESIFSVTEQTRLLRNIQDIIDELGMLKAVFDDQIQVLKGADEEFAQDGPRCRHGCLVTQQGTRCPHSSKALVDQSLKHLKHVERMQVQANQAYGTLKDLLNLKQQQAYVLEARVSRNEAISSGVQSKTIMVFTIVTIIFLPLTFVTTVFTLPIAEFQRVVLPAGSDFPPTPFLSKSYISKYIIGITFAVAVPLILAAFEIQSVLNGWKLLRLNMAKRKKEKELREMKVEDDGMPDFLKGN